MKKLFQHKAFILGIIFGFLLLVAANYRNYLVNSSFTCDDCGFTFGFPFNLYLEGGFVSTKEVLWFGLLADILITSSFGYLSGLVFKFVWSKFSSQKLR